MDEGRLSVFPDALYGRLGPASAPIVIDVRPAGTGEAADKAILGSFRRAPEQVDQWQRDLGIGRPIVVYDGAGGETGQQIAATLRADGLSASFLLGGFKSWVENRLPTRKTLGSRSGKWVTRERPKVDRIACPWLIRRFIDPEAEFLYVPTEQVFAIAEEAGATPYDIPGAESFSHDGEPCSFDDFLKVFEIADPGLDQLALIVRGADTGRPDLSPQSSGLLALSLGLSANFSDDHAMLEHGMVMYDALYAWCRSLQRETHTWTPAAYSSGKG